MAPLAKRLHAQAPGVSMHMHATDDLDFFDHLETGALDLVIGSVRDIPDGFETEELVVDTYCGLARLNHPLFNAPITVDVLKLLPVVGIGPRRHATSASGEALARKGIGLHTTMTVQHLFAASEVLRHTDLVTFVMRRVTTRHAAIYSYLDDLRPFELPIALEPVPCLMIWHRYMNGQPAHTWLRRQLADCFVEVM